MVRNRGTNTLKHKHEEHDNMQLSLKTTPSGLPLQGSEGISQASLDLSSSRGVWQPRKCKKVKGEEEKITTSREKGSFVPNFLD